MDLIKIRKQMTGLFLKGWDSARVADDAYTDFSYPKLLKFMKFHTDRYVVPCFGHFMTMHTRTAFGMELLTASFMPDAGASVPYCLIDIMMVGKKRTVFVEYYDCRAEKTEMTGLQDVCQNFDHLVEYPEKPKWYVGERTPYSLIKCGGPEDEAALVEMIIASVKAYRAAADAAGADPANIAGLLHFRDRMIREGNPSSAVLEKVFGKKGAEDFFVRCVMPAQDT